MASQPAPRPTLKAQRLIDANSESPLVYQSTDGAGCSYRLEDGQLFELTDADCRSLGGYIPRWRHLTGAA